MNIQPTQVQENATKLCYEAHASDFIEVKRFIEPMESIVLYEHGVLKSIFKGPQVVNLEEYQKKTKNNGYSEIRLFYIKESKLLSETISNELTFGMYDFLYRILINMRMSYSFKMSITEYDQFIELLSPNKSAINIEQLTKLITPRIEYCLKRSLLSLIKDKKTSFLDAPRYLSEICRRTNEDISERVIEYGVHIDFKLENLDFVDLGSVIELKAIMGKAKEMELLNYTYQQENLTDYIMIIDEDAEVQD